MKPTRIGLMGFGRIGRNLFRLLYQSEETQICAIADRAEPEALEYLLRFDTVLGRFPDEVSARDGHLYAAGRQVAFLTGDDSSDVAWADHGVDVVIEATSRSGVTRAELEGHLERGANNVVLCVPPAEPPDITILMGINHDQLDVRHKIISNGSCTAHCVAPILRLLGGAFGIERAFVSSVHAYTNQQRLADVPSEDPRRGRAAAENIIPQETNAAQLLVEILPELQGKLSAHAMNVPVHNGSVVDLVCWHHKTVSETAINEVVRTAATTDRWCRYLDYEDEPIVSSDIEQQPFSCTFDSEATMVLEDRVSKTLSWFDNSWGYVHRVVELVERLGEMQREAAS